MKNISNFLMLKLSTTSKHIARHSGTNSVCCWVASIIHYSQFPFGSRTIQSLSSFLYGLIGSKLFLNVSVFSQADVPFCFSHCRCEAANQHEKQYVKAILNCCDSTNLTRTLFLGINMIWNNTLMGRTQQKTFRLNWKLSSKNYSIGHRSMSYLARSKT